MTVKLRLARGGSKKRPYYQIVAADERSPRDGRYIERIGSYNPLLPKNSDERVKLDAERAKHWLERGAQPTDRVLRFLDAAGILTRPARNNPNKAKPGAKALERLEARRQAEEEAKAAEAEAPADDAPAEGAPAEESPAEESPAEEAPAEEASAQETADEEAPAEEASAQEAAAETPAEEPPAEDAPAEDTTAEEAPAETEGEEPKAG